MSQDQTSGVPSMRTSPINIIVGGAGIGLLAAATAVAYVRSQKASGGKVSQALEGVRPSASFPVNFKGKWALGMAIRMIEHDTSRKVLLAVLKSMAKRAK